MQLVPSPLCPDQDPEDAARDLGACKIELFLPLWIFTQLPDDYVVLDTGTTGLPDENGLPDIINPGTKALGQRETQRQRVPTLYAKP